MPILAQFAALRKEQFSSFLLLRFEMMSISVQVVDCSIEIEGIPLSMNTDFKLIKSQEVLPFILPYIFFHLPECSIIGSLAEPSPTSS